MNAYLLLSAAGPSPLFTAIPAWTYANCKKDWYTLGAALTLAKLENKWIKLSAATQRAIFGDVRLGKQSVGIFDGELKVTRKVCFGTDSDTRFVNPGEVRV
jgi:hypothetical protein